MKLFFRQYKIRSQTIRQLQNRNIHDLWQCIDYIFHKPSVHGILQIILPWTTSPSWARVHCSEFQEKCPWGSSSSQLWRSVDISCQLKQSFGFLLRWKIVILEAKRLETASVLFYEVIVGLIVASMYNFGSDNIPPMFSTSAFTWNVRFVLNQPCSI